MHGISKTKNPDNKLQNIANSHQRIKHRAISVLSFRQQTLNEASEILEYTTILNNYSNIFTPQLRHN